MEFSRQEYWRGLPCPSPEDLPNSEIEPKSALQADIFFLQSEPPGKPISKKHHLKKHASPELKETRVPGIGRGILNHLSTREAPQFAS